MQITTNGTLVKVYEKETYGQKSVKQRVTIRQEVPSHPAGIADEYHDLYVYDGRIDSDLLKALQGQKVKLELTIDSYPVRPRGVKHAHSDRNPLGERQYKNVTILNLRKICLL
jgi:hypothetical protein